MASLKDLSEALEGRGEVLAQFGLDRVVILIHDRHANRFYQVDRVLCIGAKTDQPAILVELGKETEY